MKQTLDVLVIEDNEYYNNIILNALSQSIHFIQKKLNFRLVLHSFTNPIECIRKIETSFFKNNVVAFIDHNPGNGINGSQIICLLKRENINTIAILLSQTPDDGKRSINRIFDFFILKDTFAPALCRLYLDQYIEDKFL